MRSGRPGPFPDRRDLPNLRRSPRLSPVPSTLLSEVGHPEGRRIFVGSSSGSHTVCTESAGLPLRELCILTSSVSRTGIPLCHSGAVRVRIQGPSAGSGWGTRTGLCKPDRTRPYVCVPQGRRPPPSDLWTQDPSKPCLGDPLDPAVPITSPWASHSPLRHRWRYSLPSDRIPRH